MITTLAESRALYPIVGFIGYILFTAVFSALYSKFPHLRTRFALTLLGIGFACVLPTLLVAWNIVAVNKNMDSLLIFLIFLFILGLPLIFVGAGWYFTIQRKVERDGQVADQLPQSPDMSNTESNRTSSFSEKP